MHLTKQLIIDEEQNAAVIKRSISARAEDHV